MSKKNQNKNVFYNRKPILKTGAHYNIIFGERSNGKTYAFLEYALEEYVNHGSEAAYIRRYREDFTGKRGQQLFSGLTANGAVERITGGEWTTVYYYASRWYLCRYDEKDIRITDERPFMYGFELTGMEHEKGSGYPHVRTVILDEFISRMGYLPDEFVLFMNVLSTIIRRRDDVKIFMLGNTVNKYCPYFAEMGLKHIRDMKQGTIDTYELTTANGPLRIAVEYCAATDVKSKPSSKYFAFDNAKLKMITSGTWELDFYPHCPYRYRPKDILFTYFICFDGEMLQCEIVLVDGHYFTFIHRKTTELKNEDSDIVFSDKFDSRPNWISRINKPTNAVTKKIAGFFTEGKVFYQDNEVGDIVHNYLVWCVKRK